MTGEVGLVVAARRRHFAVALDDGTTIDCVLKGRSLPVACGDRVRVARFAGGGAIEAVLPRTSLLWRSDAFREKLLAGNVDQVAAVVAPDLPVDEELVHRWAIAAQLEHCRYLLIVNKSDLPGVEAMRARLAPMAKLGATLVTASAIGDPAPLVPLFRGRHSVFVGQSGMGKSTLLNALVPGAVARTGAVSEALRTGRHTTTETMLHRLPGDPDGWIVDSPGLNTFGLAHAEPRAIEDAFVDIAPLIDACRFRDCRHDREPGCAVTAAVEDGRIPPHRLALLHALLAESKAKRDPAR